MVSERERETWFTKWVGEAMKREKRGERVFKSSGRAKETGKISGL